MQHYLVFTLSFFIFFNAYSQDTISPETVTMRKCHNDTDIFCYFLNKSIFNGVIHSRKENITSSQALTPLRDGAVTKRIADFTDSTKWGDFYQTIENGHITQSIYIRGDGGLKQTRLYKSRKKQRHYYNSPLEEEDGKIEYTYKLYKNGNTRWTKFYDKNGKLTSIAKFNKNGSLKTHTSRN